MPVIALFILVAISGTNDASSFKTVLAALPAVANAPGLMPRGLLSIIDTCRDS